MGFGLEFGLGLGLGLGGVAFLHSAIISAELSLALPPYCGGGGMGGATTWLGLGLG